MKIDYKTLNADLLRRCPGILAEWFPEGQVRGREFVVGSTNGEKGKSLSVNTQTGIWSDFATDDGGGDLVELYAKSHSLKNQQAAEQLIDRYTIRDAVEDECLMPIPVEFHREAKIQDASMVHEYRHANGSLLFYVLRYDQGPGKKYFVPLSYWRDSGWQKKMPPGKRPLYGLPLLVKSPDATVVVVEGEKSADAGAGDYVYVTWPGGSSAYNRADWNVLDGRDVILWPDADDPGIKAMNGLVEILKKTKIRLIHMLDVSEQSGGWDVADAVAEGWTTHQLTKWIETKQQLTYPLKDKPEEFGENVHFRPMGYHGKSFVFYIQATGQIVVFKGTELELSGNWNTLAPEAYWSDMYESKKKLISNSLIRASEKVGYYDPSVVRGRGVWEDEDRSVLHLGNRLVVDGEECNIRTFRTNYIYEQRVAMHIRTRDPLSASQATRLIDVCNLIRWDEPISGFLLAGWIFSAIICGVLPWRSHIYLTGPVGSGKSWIIENIIKRCLRGIGMDVQGKTTEPALRQAMQGDARPVLFDESESDGKENASRMQRVFDLARQASSEDAAPILKGTQNQSGALQYSIRSCFAFASIQASMTHYADESRITLLRLGIPYDGGGGPRFQKLLKARNNVLTEEFCDGLIFRAVQLAPIVRRNHKIFAEAGEEMFGNRRAADQFAMMLAGLYGLVNDGQLQDHDDAKEFMLRYDWEGRIRDRPAPSEATLLDTILQSEVPIDSGANRKMLGELIASEASMNGVEYTYRIVLRRHGLRIKEGRLYVANRCVNLSKVLKDTPWATKWNQTLINTRGAERSSGPVYFAAGINERAVSIPMPESLSEGVEVE